MIEQRGESAWPCKNNDPTHKSDQQEMPGNTSTVSSSPSRPPNTIEPLLTPTFVNLRENGEIRRLGAICFYRES